MVAEGDKDNSPVRNPWVTVLKKSVPEVAEART
jgi:hypothetical protein